MMEDYSLILIYLIIFVIQWIMFLVSYQLKTEIFYDLTGAATQILCTCLSLHYSPPPISPKKVLAMAMLILWATRLGVYLFSRALTAGDWRFQKVKNNFSLFFNKVSKVKEKFKLLYELFIVLFR